MANFIPATYSVNELGPGHRSIVMVNLDCIVEIEKGGALVGGRPLNGFILTDARGKQYYIEQGTSGFAILSNLWQVE
jgi:hypothetical protein